MDFVSNSSEHRPILLHMSFSRDQKGKGFWRFNNALLNDFEFIQGCNDIIKRIMLQYSGQLRLSRMNSEPTREEYAGAEYDISNTLLHDVILLEVRAFVMKYQANKRRKEKEKTDNLESEIDRLQNSQDEDDIERVNNMKKELQDIEDEREMTSTRKYFAKNQLEGERPTRFFCSMNRKMKARAQFEEVHLKKKE